MSKDNIIQFLRKRDYSLVKELGQGACGKTVLLHDDQIDEHFVCKKYVPYSESHRKELFANFVREVKLLHKVHHQNIVRVFNYYLYPDQLTGFILMEFVNGADIDDFLKKFPEQANEVFLQAISGFSYLERKGILHRDIRPGNIMVSDDGIVKIIDLGFGKEIHNSKDFKKSITLNWWCDKPPSEFEDSRYDFGSEVYFVGKLFERIIQENNINHFKHTDLLGRMCRLNPEMRIQSFIEIETEIGSNQFFEIGFNEEELAAYRAFADSLCQHVTKIENGTKYADDMTRIQAKLNDVYRSCMLEPIVPDVAIVLNCFIGGNYYRRMKSQFPVVHLKDFLRLVKISTEEKKRIILSNLHTKFDALPHYSIADETVDDVPF